MSIIKAIIFDFGDVFINLDKQGAMQNALSLFELKEFSEELLEINYQFEKGLMTSDEFLNFYSEKFPKHSKNTILNAWNYILKDFPKNRLDFLKQLKNQYDFKLILLSNTNVLHIEWIKKHIPFYTDFKSCFDKFYLSYEIHLRKPNGDIFNFVLSENKLIANECLFIDDTKENTDTASQLGMKIWNIDETKEDVINLFTTKKELF